MSLVSNLLLYAAILLPVGYLIYQIATSHVVRAVFVRNVMSYFSGILGYLFIVVFVVVAAFLAFNNQFFTANLANLDQLTKAYPLLLLFIVPAITMTVWAEERKQGTDELLFTLPANDVEILIGKYLAVVAVYSVALAFSMTLWGVLAWYSDPGFRMFISTYLGYWLAGASLLAVGMFASALTRSATVAFVLGAIICAVPVFLSTSALGLSTDFLIETLGRYLPYWFSQNLLAFSEYLTAFSIGEHLHEFSLGVVRLSSVLYFESLAVLFLYLNLIVITERHWSRSQKWNMGLQYAVRSVSVLAILISLYVVTTQSSGRADVDLTPQRYFTLSDATRDIIDNIERDRPVTIQAFISPEVPGEFVRTKRRLEGLLRQVDQRGGSRISVRVKDTTKYNPAAEEAKTFGIEPQEVFVEEDGKQITEDVFMGLVISSSYDEVAVPFVGIGTPIEYELTRSLRTVSNAHRLTVGILQTEADVMSAFGTGAWEIVEELRRQYNVESVSADSPIEREKQLFTIDDEKHIQALKDAGEDQVPDSLRELFQEKKARLSEDLTFKVNQNGERWTLTDNRINRKYTIKRFEEEADDEDEESADNEDGEEAKPAEDKAEDKAKDSPPKYAVYTDRYDVVIAVMPSLLTREQMDNYVRFIEDGGATLIFDDPVPWMFRQRGDALVLAPRVEPRSDPRMGQSQPPDRADNGRATTLMNALGLVWDNGEVVWDFYNPYPEYEDQPWWKRGLFTVIGNRTLDQHENVATVNNDSEVTQGLERFLLLYAGTIRERSEGQMEFTPLLRTGKSSGIFEWEQITGRSEFGQTVLRPVEDSLPPLDLSDMSEEEKNAALKGSGFRPDPYSHIVAAHIRSKKGGNVNAIYVADTDMISDVFFDLRRNKWLNLNLDNVSFVLNAVDVLAGEKSYLELRRRKEPHPSLTELEKKKEELRQKQRLAVNEAKAEFMKQQEKARQVLANLQEELNTDSDLSMSERIRHAGMTLEKEQRRLQAETEKMNDELNRKTEEAKSQYQREVNKTENLIRLTAIVLPALPAILMGLVFLSVRIANERREIAPDRRR